VRPCRSSRTWIIEDIPADITPVVTEHTIPRYWCPQCHDTVEPVVPDALPGATIGLWVVVLSAWLHKNSARGPLRLSNGGIAVSLT
jgi:hypothetical protein